jgi:hypothetical protein
MKQLIVMVATVLLGIAIGSVVMSFSDQANVISESVSDNIAGVMNDYEAAAGLE